MFSFLPAFFLASRAWSLPLQSLQLPQTITLVQRTLAPPKLALGSQFCRPFRGLSESLQDQFNGTDLQYVLGRHSLQICSELAPGGSVL